MMLKKIHADDSPVLPSDTVPISWITSCPLPTQTWKRLPPTAKGDNVWYVKKTLITTTRIDPWGKHLALIPAVWRDTRVLVQPCLHGVASIPVGHRSSTNTISGQRIRTMVLQVLLDGLPLVRVTGLHHHHGVTEHIVCDRAQQVIRLFHPGHLRDRLSGMFVHDELDLGVLALHHRARVGAVGAREGLKFKNCALA